jgi:hypothetical protein
VLSAQSTDDGASLIFGFQQENHRIFQVVGHFAANDDPAISMFRVFV